MRRQTHTRLPGELADVELPEDAAHVHGVGLQDVDGLRVQQPPDAVRRALRLARCDRDARFTAQPGKPNYVLRRQWILSQAGSNGSNRLANRLEYPMLGGSGR